MRFLFLENFLKFIDLKSFHSVWIIIKSDPLIESFIDFENSTFFNLLNSFLNNHYAVADNKFVPNYFRPSPDNRLIFGGGENYTYRFPKDIKTIVRKKMLKVYPQLKNTRIDFAWGGTLAVTRNRLPYFAKIQPNVFSASGYSGHGVALSVLAGKIIAELIEGDSKRFNFMNNIPIKPFPGNSNFQWPLLVLGMLWYSLRDRFK